jgi:hypothetical protein
VLRQRTRPAAEVEHAQTGTADERGDQSCTVVGAEDELLPVPVVGAVPPVQSLKP